jgi:hypothetical protein
VVREEGEVEGEEIRRVWFQVRLNVGLWQGRAQNVRGFMNDGAVR